MEKHSILKKFLKETLNIQYNLQGTSNSDVRRNRKGYSEKAAQNRAMYLAQVFHNPDGIMFYLKCAWNLNDAYLDWLVEYSRGKSNSAKYFSAVASKKMRELNAA